MPSEIGLVDRSGEGRFEWVIDDFLSKAYEENGSFQSPSFDFSGASCYLKSYFYKGYDMSVSLCTGSTSIVRKLNVKLGMKTGHGGRLETRSGETDSQGNFKVLVWMECSEMFKRRRKILRNGSLTVYCELRSLRIKEGGSKLEDNVPSVETVAEESESEDNGSEDSESYSEDDEFILKGIPEIKLWKDLSSLLNSGEDSDVTIKVQGKEFRAHRNILRARSPVFKSMFTHEMVEKQSGVVAIEDCDPVTFPDFLNYLYTGKTECICEGNVCRLYTAADKYDVKELKEGCAVFMKNNLSVRKFCDIITLAVRHDERELLYSATEFFCANARKIILTARWQTFLRKNSTVGNELFIKFISNKRSA